MTENKLKVGVIFGGRSGEHAVSLMSARFVLSQLDPEKYEVIQIGITPAGDWLAGEDALETMIAGQAETLAPVTLLPTPSAKGLYQVGQDDRLQFLTELDVVFPVLHGTFGEDGTLQGLLELADLAYVGPGVTGSAVGMDKAIFADVMTANQIPVVKTVLILRSEIEVDVNAAIEKAQTAGDYPLFVKPCNLGGITR